MDSNPAWPIACWAFGLGFVIDQTPHRQFTFVDSRRQRKQPQESRLKKKRIANEPSQLFNILVRRVQRGFHEGDNVLQILKMNVQQDGFKILKIPIYSTWRNACNLRQRPHAEVQRVDSGQQGSSIEVEPSPIAVRDLGLEVNFGGIFS